MTYKITLKKDRAEIVVRELNNETKIISEPDEYGWVKIQVVLNNDWDALQLYHAGMRALMDSKKVAQ